MQYQQLGRHRTWNPVSSDCASRSSYCGNCLRARRDKDTMEWARTASDASSDMMPMIPHRLRTQLRGQWIILEEGA